MACTYCELRKIGVTVGSFRIHLLVNKVFWSDTRSFVWNSCVDSRIMNEMLVVMVTVRGRVKISWRVLCLQEENAWERQLYLWILRGCCCSECRSKQTLIYKALERAITQFGFWLVTHTAAQFQIIPILMCIAATCQDWLALLHRMGILYALHLNSWVLLRVMLQRSGMPFPRFWHHMPSP